MDQYRYILQKKGKKLICPDCGKKTFVPFVDTATGEQLPDDFGRCDREVNCAYFLSPYKEGFTVPTANGYHYPRPAKERPKMPTFVKVDLLKQTRKAYDENNFVIWLNQHFDPGIANQLITRYHIGTSNHWPGATIFWQIDTQGRVRSGKIMLYNPATGRRVKHEKYTYINWVHSVLKLKDFELKQCLFGEHLLKQYPASPVAIVESEKTAIIASVYLTRFVWLAAGSLSNLTVEKCQPLAGRKVYLFPDLNGYDKWQEKANQISKLMPGTLFKISNFLQIKAPEADKQKGLDLADYLIRFDYKEFIKSGGEKSEKSEPEKTTFNNKQANLSDTINGNKTAIIEKNDIKTTCFNSNESGAENSKRRIFTPLWDIAELGNCFNGIPLPSEPLKINRYTTINDVRKIIDSHIETLKNNNGNHIYTSFFDRLMELKRVLKIN
ncbi:DUF6371 domain-containing protein [uncultured Mucilaginibacter sp.]|uniref:DUF6965 family protein n=2 Tax=uncultured Mucilaginibacter sp. TaxID=797541 RepID=UPI0025DEF68A|nr:DUF6371 domain-containing protein [uncultured Mucilaginibacter sp.]